MRYLNKLLFLVLNASFLLSSNLSACSKESYIVGYSEFFPFMYTAEDSEVKGLDIKLVRKVFEQACCTIKLVNMPWSRIVKGLRNGVPDVALVASKTKERSVYAYFSIPYRNEQMRFMIRNNEASQWPIQSLQDVLKFKMRIAVVLNNWFGEEFA
ncbi:transporter substrate-binding domain-containing protein, partial [Endozoicomonas sp. SM1973]